MKRLQNIIFLIPILALLTACQPKLNPNSYNVDGGMGGNVQTGMIQDIQYHVQVDKNTGFGGVAGGVAGGAVGSNLGGAGGTLGILGAVGGAVVGGIAGSAAESNVSKTTATLYIIKLDTGKMVSVIQQSPAPLCVGDHVYVISNKDRPHLKLDTSYYATAQQPRAACSQPDSE